MPKVTAIQSFEHNGPRRRGESFPASPTVAEQLRKKGLVIVAGEPLPAADPRPHKASGATSSASPVARASRQTTSKKSGSGAKPKRQKDTAAP